MQTTTNTVILLYSRHCPGSIEWAKYLHKLFTELSKHKGKLRYAHAHVFLPSPTTKEHAIVHGSGKVMIERRSFLSE